MRKIEDYPDTFKGIQAFYKWSVSSYSSDEPSPFNTYLNFIGYSSGVLSGDLFGFHEYCLLSDALKVFENHGYEDVYAYIDLLKTSEV